MGFLMLDIMGIQGVIVNGVEISITMISKIPTRFLLGMIDADSYIGNWQKNPLNFQHQRAAFFL